MKKTTFLTIIVSLGVCAMISSCNDHENELPHSTKIVRFTSPLNKLAADAYPANRASGINWENDDAIGVCMLDLNSGNVIGEVANKKYDIVQTGDLGTFSPSDGNDIYYPLTGKVKFTAYYPWRLTGDDGIVDDLYPVNVANQGTPANIDLLWATADNENAGYDKLTTGAVSMAFEHKLAKLVIIPSAGEGVEDLTIQSVNITGIYTTANFNVKTGILDSYNDKASLTPSQPIAGIEQYEAIILPFPDGIGEGVTIEFTTNLKTFVWNVPANAQFHGGKKHIWNITLANTAPMGVENIRLWDTGADDVRCVDTEKL